MKLLKFLSTALLPTALFGCEQRPIEPCPQAGRDFLEGSIRAYFDKSYPKFGGSEVQILLDEEYNAYNKSWIVSVDAPDHEYFAIVSCTGRVESSGRQLGPSTPPGS